jgi:hypothetical protein
VPSSYVPTHRALDPASTSTGTVRRLARSGRRTLALSGVAAATTGLAVTAGIVLTGEGSAGEAAAATTAATAPVTASATATPVSDLDRAATAAILRSRTRSESRSVRRAPVDATKARALNQTRTSGGQVSATEDLTTGDPRTVARAMLAKFGFGQDQFSCLDSLYTRESGWNVHADNPSSSAYGIPQSLPGEKMASAGADWADNPATQIEWGLGYIKSRYGTPCGAWSHSEAHNWY